MRGGVAGDAGDLVAGAVVAGFGCGGVSDGFCGGVPVAGVVVVPGLCAWVVGCRSSLIWLHLPRCEAVAGIVGGGEAGVLD